MSIRILLNFVVQTFYVSNKYKVGCKFYERIKNVIKRFNNVTNLKS